LLNANYINCVIDGIGFNGNVSIEIIKSSDADLAAKVFEIFSLLLDLIMNL